jgi:hypothetical protein
MTTELDELKKRIEELEKAAKPLEPFVPGPRFQFDPTANASMPASAMKAMIDAVPDRLMNELRSDALKPNPITGGPNPQPQTRAVQRGSGWRDEVPISSPPGVALADRLVDHRDRIDKAELAIKLMKAGMLKK